MTTYIIQNKYKCTCTTGMGDQSGVVNFLATHEN